tara:strand:+ start:2306 stop:2917 length:612 start_codon:yes stop_codon:yes gene_type:complete
MKNIAGQFSVIGFQNQCSLSTHANSHLHASHPGCCTDGNKGTKWILYAAATHARKTQTQGNGLDSHRRVSAVSSSALLISFGLGLFYEKIRQQSGQMLPGLGFGFDLLLSRLVTSLCPLDSDRAVLAKTTNGKDCSCSPSVPTPCARDWKGMSSKKWRERTGKKKFATLPDKIGGTPHPEYVEQLMGFPIGWSELKPAEMQLT